ncbi:MAG: HEPN domain-containing protein [Methanogenium sp.]|nr:HEPN domain-containing protein [Methanogenium sp.]
MRSRFERCLETRKIVKIEKDNALVLKEITEAGRDLESAKISLNNVNFKWAIVQGYYSQFHSIRALVFSEGYREKSHSCLRSAAEALLFDAGLIDREVIEGFSYAMRVREAADYNSTYTEDTSIDVVDTAERTYDISMGIIGKISEF